MSSRTTLMSLRALRSNPVLP